MALKDYSIGDLSALVNVSSNTLRFWEKQAYIPTPERMMLGQRGFRRYSEGDLALIKMFKNYVDEGLTLKAAAAKLTKIMGEK
ncbi:MAG: MerR family transcriptional regulator [Desulfamplus sp.]|nr:MerR family transcriptional regulator [Desulfamplus sp.]